MCHGCFQLKQLKNAFLVWDLAKALSVKLGVKYIVLKYLPELFISCY